MAPNPKTIPNLKASSTDPTDGLLTISTTNVWHGNYGVSLDPLGTNPNLMTAVTADGAKITLNPNGSIAYDPSGSAALSALPSGQHATDTFTYSVIQGNKPAETVTQSVDVTGNAVVWTPHNETFTPTAPANGDGSANIVDGAPFGWAEYDLSGLVAPVSSPQLRRQHWT